MKSNIYKITLILISLLLIGATPLSNSNSPSFFDLNEQAIINNGNFEENGIKINYCSKMTIEKEYERLLQEVKNNEIENLQVKTNEIMFMVSSINVSILLWVENNNTMVQVIAINNDSSKSTRILKKYLDRFQNNNSTDKKYFKFIKGKIDEHGYEKTNDIFMDSIKKGTLEGLNIQNGYVGTAMFKDNQRVNIGYMKYNSGRQVIIGTPIIFVTY